MLLRWIKRSVAHARNTVMTKLLSRWCVSPTECPHRLDLRKPAVCKRAQTKRNTSHTFERNRWTCGRGRWQSKTKIFLLHATIHRPIERISIMCIMYIILLVSNPSMYNIVYCIYLNNDATHINGERNNI